MNEIKKVPRGGVHLAGAVISPSDEDSQTFFVSAACEEVYRLRANDAKERQFWVNKLREVSEHQTKTIAEQNPPIRHINSNHIVHPDSSIISGKLSNESESKEYAESMCESLLSVKDMLSKTEKCQQDLKTAIDALPVAGSQVKCFDSDLLILKATANATISCLDQCLIILQKIQLSDDTVNQDKVEESLTKTERRQSYNSLSEMKSSVIFSGSSPTQSQSIQESQSAQDVTGEVTDDENDDNDVTVTEIEDLYEKNVVLHLLSKLKLGMDLTRVSFPTFLLEPHSLLEMYANFMGHPDYFIRIADEPTPEMRMVAAVLWYLTSVHAGKKGSVAKKPYNPVLGETFKCSWKIPNDDKKESSSSYIPVTFVAEQVSHHPLMSSFYIECQKKKMFAEACITIKSKFLGISIGINLLGEGNIHLLEHGETYNFTFPSAFARSIPTVPWMELGGRISLSCSKSKCSAFITFHTNPFYGDQLHRISAEVKNGFGDLVCKINGQWNGVIQIVYAEGMTDVINVNKLTKYKKRLRPLNEQDSSESRRIWYEVTKALKNNDIEMASSYKQQIEMKQREIADADLDKNTYQGKLFHQKGDTWVYKYPLN
ncbi:oxysterol-binding protein-related protein 11-like [Centruroides sculpturatus]|uniref:oxysterol-binding protein-related protein 11-like n=1 Tax=Centruroides sculpturatus TaxID=218467 RepID=UPI000C6D527A|nr:oxysterol-binding protein-related protein 11-like [Centruroides sculpturatus]